MIIPVSMDALTAVRSVSLMAASSAASWVVETVEMKAALKAVMMAAESDVR